MAAALSRRTRAGTAATARASGLDRRWQPRRRGGRPCHSSLARAGRTFAGPARSTRCTTTRCENERTRTCFSICVRSGCRGGLKLHRWPCVTVALPVRPGQRAQGALFSGVYYVRVPEAATGGGELLLRTAVGRRGPVVQHGGGGRSVEGTWCRRAMSPSRTRLLQTYYCLYLPLIFELRSTARAQNEGSRACALSSSAGLQVHACRSGARAARALPRLASALRDARRRGR